MIALDPILFLDAIFCSALAEILGCRHGLFLLILQPQVLENLQEEDRLHQNDEAVDDCV